MVKRKTSEEILTGEKTDPRYKTSTPLADDDPMKAATRVVSPADSAASRIRKRPNVIDGTKRLAPERAPLRDADLSSLEEDLGMSPTARPGERAAPSAATKTSPVPAEGQAWKKDTTSRKSAPEQAWKEDKHAPKPGSGNQWEDVEHSNKSGAGQAWTEPAPESASAAASAPVSAPVAPPQKKIAPTTVRKKPKPASPKELSKQKATSAVTSMVDQMKARAQTNGGVLRTEDIAAMEQDFQAQVSQLTESLEQSFEAYVEARERAEWDSAREFPFGRVVVKKFSHLFKEPREGRLDTVSKRMLPGFFAGLNMMIGPESIDLFQERCRRVVESIRHRDGEDFDWDSVYASPEVNAVVIDALMSISPHFENFERRRDWFIELVNANLAHVGEHEEDAGWEFSPVGYRRFLTALFKEVHGHLGNDATFDRLSRRYGSTAVEAVKRLVERAEEN